MPELNKKLKVSRQNKSAGGKQPKGLSVGASIVAGVIVASIAFVAGTRLDYIQAAVMPAFGVKTSTDSLDTAELQRVYRDLDANFDGELDKDALVAGAARGMVQAAGDPYTAYMDASEAGDFEMSLNGEIYGIGAEIGTRDGQPTVLRVIPSSPAEKSGLRAGDVFVAVDTKEVTDQTPSQVASVVRGDEGTVVKLGMGRDGKLVEFEVTRARVSDPSVRSEMRGTTGVMTISRFDNESGKLARQAAEKLLGQGARSIVVDLRNNGGGYLDAARDIAGLWVSGKLVVSEKANGKVLDQIYSGRDAVLADTPTVVLVNGFSASASEILAGALQDYGKATLVGEQTFGKGSVQKVLSYPDGSIMKVTIAKWYTPNGKNINKDGIKPDLEVKLTSEDVDSGSDPQLAKALELAVK